VPEVAREYLAGRDGYDEADVLEIARLQAAAETTALAEGHRLVICDTDLTVIRIWWEDKFGPLPERLISLFAARAERAYLLLQPDLPWEPDPLRENPKDRDRLFGRYEALLGADAAPYRVVSGSEDQRFQSALAAIDALLPDLELPSP
jgi:nicotinamide riboside kinase